MLIKRLMLFLSGGSLAVHLALYPGIQIVEKVVIGFLTRRLALYRSGDLRLVVALHRPCPSLLGDLLLEFFDDEIGRVVGLARKFLMQRGQTLFFDPERFGGRLVQIFIRPFVGGTQPLATLRRGTRTSISAI